MGSGGGLGRLSSRGTSVALGKLNRDIEAASAHRTCGSRLSHKLMRHRSRAGKDAAPMSNEIKEWLVELVVVALAIIALVCVNGHSVDQSNPIIAPPTFVKPNGAW